MRLKPKTLTLLSLLLALFFLCDFVDTFFFGYFFFNLFLGILTIHIGLIKVIMLEASITSLDFIFDNPVRMITSVTPSLGDIPFLAFFVYIGLIGIYISEIVFFRFAFRRYLPNSLN
ncbi:MAG: hypothetical protein D4S01_05565 [Dehalococcoidia bacterium]|nr:MAG: hypothetical protein D4S01_05565 [Dehalococcoidia bacterium]